jgi:hypothetical protein
MNPRSLKDWQDKGFIVVNGQLVKRTAPAEGNHAEPGTARKRADRPPVLLKDPPKPNVTEQRFHDTFAPFWKPAVAMFQPVRLLLPSGTHYTTDWLFLWPDLTLLIEVKGDYVRAGRHRVQNERSPEAFKAARAAFSCWHFCWAQFTGSRWRFAGKPKHLLSL